MTRSSPFAALQHRNFRLLWLGLVVSTSGSLMQTAGILWHVSLLVDPGRKGLALGLVGLVRVGPIIIFSLISGLVADIHDRRRIMLATNSVATVAFGLSQTFWAMFACLALCGATDTVSTVLRSVIRQMETPDHLRGRMVGINMVFFMGGPQLGELEAGVVAQGFGAPVSVVSGGLGCLLATGWIAKHTPALRRYRR